MRAGRASCGRRAALSSPRGPATAPRLWRGDSRAASHVHLGCRSCAVSWSRIPTATTNGAPHPRNRQRRRPRKRMLSFRICPVPRAASSAMQLKGLASFAARNVTAKGLFTGRSRRSNPVHSLPRDTFRSGDGPWHHVPERPGVDAIIHGTAASQRAGCGAQ